ncbi:bifunctional DNA-formamidopyrimidine glycosylase/DNA-(apurinic or apyrimidinic site) lyase [Immundisolibacter sp.]|uniref:bifunctional DNA-formamidopyrimidine glycosylase/DNA-(apurinic or apyrimidinic site) lyase n=1 Tax=Immundisolibacter sp. TaxID=1934948 RepID=UPI00356B162A
MPELPEVETTLRGISPHVVAHRVTTVRVREPRLRWPVPPDLARNLKGQTITGLTRRAKYLLFHTHRGTMLLHLGMSGSLSIKPRQAPAAKHDHVDFILDGERCLRFTDPRRFGSLHWCGQTPLAHALLRDLGPEPLGPDFSGNYLYAASRGRRIAIKQHLMNARIVVGVGNIYASESLFRAGIHPLRSAGRIARIRMHRLVAEIRQVLTEAIAQGDTTLRDFSVGDGRPGYFQQALEVYGRDGQPCRRCGTPIRAIRQGQRATYYCVTCQR